MVMKIKFDHDSQFDETDELFFKVLQISEEALKDFNSIKTVYRKKLPSTIQIGISNGSRDTGSSRTKSQGN